MKFASPPTLEVTTRWATPDGTPPAALQPKDEEPSTPDEAVGPDLSELIVDAICGVGFPTLAIGMEAEQFGWAMPSGRRDVGPYWLWNRDALKKLTEKQLQNIYVNLKIAQYAGK